MGSRGFALPLHARGLYREMLTQAWRRGAKLPNDYDMIRRCCGVTGREWKQSWSLVQPFWRVDGDAIVNDTQQEVYAEALRLSANASRRGLAGARARLQQRASNAQAPGQALPESKPPSPSPSPKEQERVHTPPTQSSGAMAGGLPRDHLRHAVCGRVCLQEQQFEQFARKIGGSDGHAKIAEWARDLLAEWDRPPKLNQSIQGNTFQWWDARWLEFQGKPEAKLRSGTALPAYVDWHALCEHDPKCESQAMHHRALSCDRAIEAGQITRAEADSFLAKYRTG